MTTPPTDGLQLCSEVPPIETAVIGDDASGLGPDPVSLGVLQTYAQEHRDTFGEIWIDRDDFLLLPYRTVT